MSMINSERDEDYFVKLSPQTALDVKSFSDDFTLLTDTKNSKAESPQLDTNVYYGLIGCICSMLSLIIGVGIISMPYSASIVKSMWVFVPIHIICIVLILVSAMIYIQVRQTVIQTYFKSSGQNVAISVSDISYILLGRSSILIFNLFMGLAQFGVNVLIYLFFTQTAMSVFVDTSNDANNESNLLMTKCFIIIALSIAIAPSVIKRQISELEFMSYLKQTGIVCVLLVLLIKYLSKKGEQIIEIDQEDQEFLKDNESTYVERIFDCFNITISSYGFLIGFYPMYDKIHPSKRTPKNGFRASAVALILTCLVYVSFTKLSILCFGVDNIKQNIFENLSDSNDFLSQSVKVIFLVIFLCALPFNIYPVKLCVFNFIEEIRSNRISKDLDTFLKGNNTSEHKTKGIEDLVSKEFHNGVVISIMVLICIFSLLVDDLRVVFGIIGTFAEAIINFIMPGVLLVVTQRQNKEKNSFHIGIGMVMAVFGTLYFFISNYFTLMKLVK